MHLGHVEPMQCHPDIVIDKEGFNEGGIDRITIRIRRLMPRWQGVASIN